MYDETGCAYSVPYHFAHTNEIWEAYFAGQISQKKREEELNYFRARLIREVPLPA